MRFVLLMFVLFMTCHVFAQALVGTYTIGGPDANYATLDAALTAAQNSGLAGETTFTLNPGTYSGPFIINIPSNNQRLNIVAGSGGYTVLTNPNSNSSSNYIVWVNTTSNITFSGLSFTGNGQYSRAIQVSGDSDNLCFTNNVFEWTNSHYTSENEGISFNANSSSDADNIEIVGNQFIGGGTHVSLATSNSGTQFTSCYIAGNEHIGGYRGYSFNQVYDITIYNNNLTGTYTGINLSACGGSLSINKNRIDTNVSGIYLYNCVSSGSTPHIYNNIVSTDGTNWNQGGYPERGYSFMLYSCTDIITAHNSVLNTSTESSSLVGVFSGTRLYIRSNQFINVGGGYALRVDSVTPSSSTRCRVEKNNLYTADTYLVKVGNTDYLTLADFSLLSNTTNYNVNPLFSDGYLHTAAPRIDNRGYDYDIATDFGGNPRNGTTPDIGAWEYTASASTPLSGTYNVGAGNTYPTLAAFTYALSLHGVNGAVTAYLTDSDYYEKLEMDLIPGVSGSNTITLTAPGANIPVIHGSLTGSNYIARFIRSQYLMLSNIEFSGSNCTNGNVLLLPGYNNSIDINYCRFTGAEPNTNYITALYGSNPVDVSLVGCQFNGGLTGVTMYGNTIAVSSCSFTNITNGVNYTSANASYVSYSSFDACSGTAIAINSGRGVNVLSNRITNSYKGIYLSQITATGSRNLVANNVIKQVGDGGYGISYSAIQTNIVYNTVWCSNTNSALYSYQLGTSSDIVNNILASENGLALELVNTPTGTNAIDYNCLYSEGNYLASIGGQGYNNLSTLQTAFTTYNAHSISCSPILTANMHTTSQWIRNKGLALTSVTADIDNETRGTTVDIGADEQNGQGVVAPMAGTYNVGGNSPDFASIETCITALETRGISANVIININAGTYPGRYTLHSIPSNSITAYVSFVAKTGSSFSLVPIEGVDTNNYIFSLKGTDNVKFTDFVWSTTTVGYNASNIILLSGYCERIYFSYCQFDLANVSTKGINAQSSIGRELYVNNCIFSNGSNGISINGSYNNPTTWKYVTIKNCTFNGTQYPFNLNKITSLTVSSNTCNSFSNLVFGFIEGPSRIEKNRLFMGGMAGSFSAPTIVQVTNCVGAVSSQVTLENNILVCSDNETQSFVALLVAYSNHVAVINNTIAYDNKSYGDWGQAISVLSTSDYIVANNVLTALSKGQVASVSQATNGQWLNNAYFCRSLNGAVQNGTYIATADFISSVLMDEEGIFTDPLIDSNGFVTCSYLKGRGIIAGSEEDIDGVSRPEPCDLGANNITTVSGVPLHGTINIGQGGDYATLNEAIEVLVQRGIDGALTLNLLPQSHTRATVNYIPGMLANSLTIVGTTGTNFVGNAIGESDNYLLKLDSVYNTTVSTIAFRPGNVAYARGIVMSNLVNNTLIEDCSFTLATNEQQTGNNAAVYLQDASYKGLKIKQCQISNYAYGIHLSGFSFGNIPPCNGLEISRNTIVNPYTGINVYYSDNPHVLSNDIQNSKLYGINISNGIRSAVIMYNQVSGTGYAGINLQYNSYNPGDQQIFNNYVRCTTGNAHGLLVLMSNAKIYNNTIVCDNSSPSGNAAVACSGTGMEFINNICANSAAPGAYFSNSSDLSAFHHNLFYSTGTSDLVLNATNIPDAATLTAINGDTRSIFANPLLQGNSFMLQAASPAINAGMELAEINCDISAQQRVNIDMGCYEYGYGMLPAPSQVSIRIEESSGKVILSWSNVQNASGYKVYMAEKLYNTIWETQQVGSGINSLEIPINSGFQFFKVSTLQ